MSTQGRDDRGCSAGIVVLLAFLLTALGGLGGCDGGSSGAGDSYDAPPPVHPAMRAEPTGGTGEDAALQGSPHGAAGAAGLPAGHPPVASADSSGAEPVESSAASGAGVREKLASFGLALDVPEGWKEAPSPNSIRLATFVLPKAQGDPADVELSVTPAMGSEKANIERWRGQFKERPEAKSSTLENDGVRVTVAEMEGTFTATGKEQPDTRLWTAIARVPGGSQLIFFKAWGPKATMDKWKTSFEKLAGSLRPAP